MHKLSPPSIAEKRRFVYLCEKYSARQQAYNTELTNYLHTQKHTI